MNEKGSDTDWSVRRRTGIAEIETAETGLKDVRVDLGSEENDPDTAVAQRSAGSVEAGRGNTKWNRPVPKGTTDEKETGTVGIRTGNVSVPGLETGIVRIERGPIVVTKIGNANAKNGNPIFAKEKLKSKRSQSMTIPIILLSSPSTRVRSNTKTRRNTGPMNTLLEIMRKTTITGQEEVTRMEMIMIRRLA